MAAEGSNVLRVTQSERQRPVWLHMFHCSAKNTRFLQTRFCTTDGLRQTRLSFLPENGGDGHFLAAVLDNLCCADRYLKGIVQAGAECGGNSLADAENVQKLPSAPEHRRGTRNLHAEAQASELYIRLMCRFEPASVLPFLQSHESYRVQVSHR